MKSTGSCPDVGLLVAAGLALVVGVLVAGCQDQRSGESSDVAWPSGDVVVDRAGLAWSLDGVVHLADGSQVDTGADVSTFVVAGPGVFTADGGLHVNDLDGGRTDLGIEVATLASSGDGRLVAAVDLSSGPKDDFGTPQAEVVVADLTSGRELVRTAHDMGSRDDDLAALYPEIEFGLRFVDDGTLAVRGAEGDYTLDVDSGRATPIADGANPFESDVVVSPDGAWRIESVGGFRDTLVSTDGTTVTPDTGSLRWDLEWWADATSVVGYAIDGGGTGTSVADDASVALISCTVPAGTCRRYDETAGHPGVAFPADSRSEPSYSLTPRYLEE